MNALGKQPIVAAFNIFSYYAVGLPFGLWMTYNYDWGLIGVWSGVAMAGFIKCVGEGVLLFFVIDWEAQCLQSSQRIGSQELAPVLPCATSTIAISHSSNNNNSNSKDFNEDSLPAA